MNKKLLIGIMMVLVMSIFSSAVLADVSVKEASANSQLVVYSADGDAELDRRKLEDDISLERTFTVENTGTEELTNVVVDVTDLNADLNTIITSTEDTDDVNTTVTVASLASGATFSVVVEAVVPGAPDDSDNYAYSGSGINEMGTMIISSTEDGNSAYNLVFDNEDLLEIYKERVKVYFDDDEENVEDGETLDDISPGDKITVEVTLRNLIDEDTKYDRLEDIVVYIQADDMDDGSDFDDDDEISKISGEDTDSLSFEFEVPMDIAADDYQVLISGITAVDEFGNTHTIPSFSFDIEVVRERNKIEIESLRFIDEKVRCNQKTANLYVKIKNVGERDQDEPAIRILQSELNIDIWDQDIDELVTIEDDEDDAEYRKTYTLPIPADVSAGTYYVTVNSYFDENIMTDNEDIELVIEGCQVVEEPVIEVPITVPDEIIPEVVTEPVVVTPVKDNTETVEPVVTDDVKAESSLKDSPLVTSLLIVANIGLLVLIVGLGIRLFKKN